MELAQNIEIVVVNTPQAKVAKRSAERFLENVYRDPDTLDWIAEKTKRSLPEIEALMHDASWVQIAEEFETETAGRLFAELRAKQGKVQLEVEMATAEDAVCRAQAAIQRESHLADVRATLADKTATATDRAWAESALRDEENGTTSPLVGPSLLVRAIGSVERAWWSWLATPDLINEAKEVAVSSGKDAEFRAELRGVEVPADLLGETDETYTTDLLGITSVVRKLNPGAGYLALIDVIRAGAWAYLDERIRCGAPCSDGDGPVGYEICARALLMFALIRLDGAQVRGRRPKELSVEPAVREVRDIRYQMAEQKIIPSSAENAIGMVLSMPDLIAADGIVEISDSSSIKGARTFRKKMSSGIRDLEIGVPLNDIEERSQSGLTSALLEYLNGRVSSVYALDLIYGVMVVLMRKALFESKTMPPEKAFANQYEVTWDEIAMAINWRGRDSNTTIRVRQELTAILNHLGTLSISIVAADSKTRSQIRERKLFELGDFLTNPLAKATKGDRAFTAARIALGSLLRDSILNQEGLLQKSSLIDASNLFSGGGINYSIEDDHKRGEKKHLIVKRQYYQRTCLAIDARTRAAIERCEVPPAKGQESVEALFAALANGTAPVTVFLSPSAISNEVGIWDGTRTNAEKATEKAQENGYADDRRKRYYYRERQRKVMLETLAKAKESGHISDFVERGAEGWEISVGTKMREQYAILLRAEREQHLTMAARGAKLVQAEPRTKSQARITG